MLFIIAALRAVLEMLGLCLLGQGLLYLIAGAGRRRNPIYRLFAVVTAPPLALVRRAMPHGCSAKAAGFMTLATIFAAWIALALLRKFL